MAPKKHLIDLLVVENQRLGEKTTLLRCTDPVAPLPEMLPGQFAQLRVDGSSSTMLRRPISINFVDRVQNEIWFMVQLVGDGTHQLAKLKSGDTLNALLPLGNGFTLKPLNHLKPFAPSTYKPLLVGGGVGIAPLLFLGSELRSMGVVPTFLLGARTASLLTEMDSFRNIGKVYVTTEDGSLGEKGFVTQHSILQKVHFDQIHVCGPSPMMKAVARFAKDSDTPCEVSLENMMACGLGACLCCVEKTVRGNVCVCTEGPVFDIKELNW